MEANIWSPFQIKGIKLGNRIVRSATNEHLGTLEGNITDAYIDVYRKLASSGVGLLITSHMAVLKAQRADLTHICINEKSNYERLKELTNEVHKTKAKIVCQISYGGCRAVKTMGKQALSPSGNDGSTEMTLGEIKECIENYVNAVQVAYEVGFDGVQLHLAHGYLLSEFLESYYNKRTDAYGGNLMNRYRIVREILEKIKLLSLDDSFLVMAKINSTSQDNNSLFLDEQMQVCKWLENDGVDAIEVSGSHFKKYKQDTPYFLENALRIKEAVSIPILLVGGFREEKYMNTVLRQGIDLVSMCRPFISEEDFIAKLKCNGKSRCISCNKCFSIYKTEFKNCIFGEIKEQLYRTFGTPTHDSISICSDALDTICQEKVMLNGHIISSHVLEEDILKKEDMIGEYKEEKEEIREVKKLTKCLEQSSLKY